MRSLNANTRCSIIALGLGAAVACFAVRAAEAQPAELDRWREIESANFTVLTDAPGERGKEVATALESFRAVFSRLSPGIELRSPAPTRIVAFRDGDSFAPYRPAASGGGEILGQFIARPDGNFITLDSGHRGLEATTVLQHEYVHYLVRHNFPRVPLWFHEGLAEYYSNFVIEDGVGILGRPIDRHRDLLARLDGLGLEEVLAVGSGETSHGGGEVAGRFYAVSWALVHYLLAGDDLRLERTADFLLRLGEGEEAWRAAEDAFGVRIDDLEESVREHLLSGITSTRIPLHRLGTTSAVTLRKVAPAAVLSQLGDLLLWVGQRESARDHYQAALAHDPSHADAQAGLGRLMQALGGSQQAELLFTEAVALPGAGAATHLAYGRLLLELVAAEAADRGDAGDASDLQDASRVDRLGRARDELDRALALEPDFAEALALRGASYLLAPNDEDTEWAAGIHALERARALLPERFDIAANLARLHLRAADPAAARAVIRRDLEGWAPVELVERLAEDVARTELLLAAQAAFAEERIEEGLRLFDEAVDRTSDPRLREQMEAELRRLQARDPS